MPLTTHNMTTAQAAEMAHEANRIYCESIGDHTQGYWKDASQSIRDSAIKEVEYIVENWNSTPEQQHEAWLAHKIADGWTYGVPLYQKKDKLFQLIVKAALSF